MQEPSLCRWCGTEDSSIHMDGLCDSCRDELERRTESRIFNEHVLYPSVNHPVKVCDDCSVDIQQCGKCGVDFCYCNAGTYSIAEGVCATCLSYNAAIGDLP